MKKLPKGRSGWLFLIARWVFIFLFVVVFVYHFENMPGDSYKGEVKPLSNNEKVLKAQLQNHIHILAETIGERNMEYMDRLEETVVYIKDNLTRVGYEYVNLQEYQVRNRIVKNIEVEIKGQTLPQQIVVVGAHYDSVFGSPGANDNGTAVAALLEIAAFIRKTVPKRTVRFVFFVNEEPPFFETQQMGSRVYAKRAREAKEDIIAMFAMDTIGYYTDESGSQKYPSVLRFFYPDKGNFLAFTSNITSRHVLYKAIAIFRKSTPLPSLGIAAFEWIPGVGWSDHWSFWKEGYPAILMTDTAPFRYKYYHTHVDTYDKIDYDRYCRVVLGIREIVLEFLDNK
ncbi:MAG: M28 family peptidase [Candidatus Magnetoovum sp. WYHC-5]|nr:M28 family peptidase [Candidatus Magnetoovum sp. WYHC-5]